MHKIQDFHNNRTDEPTGKAKGWNITTEKTQMPNHYQENASYSILGSQTWKAGRVTLRRRPKPCQAGTLLLGCRAAQPLGLLLANVHSLGYVKKEHTIKQRSCP